MSTKNNLKRWFIGGFGALAAAGVMLAWPADAAETAKRVPVDCLTALAALTAPSTSAGVTGPGSTLAAVVVLPVAQIQLDAAGQPTSVRTNTHSAPSCTEQSWYTLSADGQQLELAPLALINTVMNAVDAADTWPSTAWHRL